MENFLQFSSIFPSFPQFPVVNLLKFGFKIRFKNKGKIPDKILVLKLGLKFGSEFTWIRGVARISSRGQVEDKGK